MLGACIWVGGHLILCLSILPQALKEKDPEIIRAFEKRYERVGIPALCVQAITGLRLAAIYVGVDGWFSFNNVMTVHISLKLILLILTILLAIHARFFIIPKLSVETLSALAMHIVVITILALALLFTGLNFRLDFI